VWPTAKSPACLVRFLVGKWLDTPYTANMYGITTYSAIIAVLIPIK